MGLQGPTTAADAERQLQAAIELGTLTSQQAPAGHPIFAAIQRAQDDLASIQDEESSIVPALVPGTRTYQEISDAIDGITDAAAGVTNNPDLPLPRTLFQLPQLPIPWWSIAAGVGALALGWYLFQRKGRYA